MTNTQTYPSAGSTDIRKGQLWTGRILWAISVPFMLLDAGLHIAKPGPVLEAFEKLQIPVSTSVGLGVLELILVALYVIPRTAVLGAVLLTGYLGGAMAIHMRVGDPLWFPVLVGALLWGSLWCRDARVRSLFA